MSEDQPITPAVSSEMPLRLPCILQLIPELETGGAERGAVDMALAIAAAGGRAIVASAGGKMVAELADKPQIQLVIWPSLKSKNPFKIMANGWRLKALVGRERVDLIHARSRAPAWSGWLAAKLSDVPFMTTFHSPYNFSGQLKRLYNSVMARGARVIAISDFIRQHILAHYATPPARIRLVHRGIDVVRFDPAAVSPDRVAAVRAAWGVTADTPVILLPGRLTRWKGQRVLIDAMAQLQDLAVVAVCVGGDQGRSDYRRELYALIARHGFQGRVILAGDCADMPAACLASTLVLSCSVEAEAFGRVIAEAQAMGRPVIVSDCGAVAETVGATSGGWIVPPADPSALAATIRAALALPQADRDRLGQAAQAYVRAHYTRAQMVAKTLAVYNELLPDTYRFKQGGDR